MPKRPSLTDEELDEQIKQLIDPDTGNLPSINTVLENCSVGRVRAQQRLLHWREQEATRAIEVADIPGSIREDLMLALDRALSGLVLRERKLAQGSYASKWLAVQSDIEDTNAAYAKLEQECQLLRNENDRLAAQLKTVNETLIMKAGESQTLRSQLEAAQEENSKSRAELAIATAKAVELSAMNAKLSHENRELDRLTEAATAAERREREAVKNAERAVSEAATSAEQARQLQADKALLESKLAGLETLRTDLALAKDEIARLRSLLYAKKKNDQGQREQGQQQQKGQRPPRNQRQDREPTAGQAAPETPGQGRDTVPAQQQEPHTATGTKTDGQPQAEEQRPIEHETFDATVAEITSQEIKDFSSLSVRTQDDERLFKKLAQEMLGQGKDAIPSQQQSEQQETHTKTAEQPAPGQEGAETSDTAKVISHVSDDVVVRKSPHSEE